MTNKITVVGNLARDPELRFTPAGAAVANFSVADTPRTFNKQTNQWEDGETTWHRCTAWRELAENIAESLTKGVEVIVIGTQKTRVYDAKDGEKKTVVEIEVESVGPNLRFASAQVTRVKRGSGSNSGGSSAPAQSQSNDGSAGYADDEPPF